MELRLIQDNIDKIRRKCFAISHIRNKKRELAIRKEMTDTACLWLYRNMIPYFNPHYTNEAVEDLRKTLEELSRK